MSHPHTANLLGALAVGLTDEVTVALEESLGLGGSAPAAVFSMGTRPGQRIEQLCQTLGLSHSATVRLVDRLVEGEYVKRQRGTDGRSLALFLTPRGERAFSEALAVRRRVLSETLSTLSEQEIDQFQALLEKLLEVFPRDWEHAHHICRLCEHAVCSQENTCPMGWIVPGVNSSRQY